MNEIRQKQRLAYLSRLLKIYSLFLEHYKDVTVGLTYNNKKTFVCITYHQPKKDVYTQFEFQTIEFPIEHLTKRINHYKGKVRTEFKNRHNEKR